jgi:leader peptidase (prepilin peptidase)/N-methyltransferase
MRLIFWPIVFLIGAVIGSFLQMPLIFWIIFVFLIGAAIGSFLNVCIYRLPLEKSIIWPGSRCGHCLRPIRWKDNIPLLSYWLLGGRCRDCGKTFSIQYFAIELLTALGFVGLFYLLIIENIHGFPVLAGPDVASGDIPWQGWVIFGHHALLLCFLLVVAICDLKWRWIPLGVTMTGTVVGLIVTTCFPWPWPYAPLLRPPRLLIWTEWLITAADTPVPGLSLWPVWYPLPSWLPPGSWQVGVVTGLAGALAGTMMLRWVRFICTKCMGLGEALGLGDADLMMMAGAFLGWQAVVVAFFLSAFPALIFSIIHLIRTGDRAVTFGPSLAASALATCLLWLPLAPFVQVLFFNWFLLLILAGGGSALLILASLVIRLLRWLGGFLRRAVTSCNRS